VEGRRVEHALPGRQGRLLLVYLVLHRLRVVPRSELIEALWPRELPRAAESSLSALLSRLRRVVPIEGRSEVRLDLPADAFVDLEAAFEAIHRAESAARRNAWIEAWAPARVALHTASRGFLPGEDAPWIDEQGNRLEDLRLRALEAVAALRESGYRILMQALETDGNPAEALAVYDLLRTRLRDELGAAPGEATQALHRALLS
jgi:DNA-binding SARP family transcriptional activator